LLGFFNWGNNRIQKFDSNGNFIKNGAAGTDPGQMNNSLIIGSDEKVYVSDSENHSLAQARI